MSTKSFIDCTVEGQYYANVNGNKIIKNYKTNFRVPSSAISLNTTLLSVVKNKLLDDKLRNTYEDYKGFRTYRITEQRSIEDKNMKDKPINQMSLSELESFALARGLAVNVRACSTVNEARQAVQDGLDDLALMEAREDSRAIEQAAHEELKTHSAEADAQENSAEEIPVDTGIPRTGAADLSPKQPSVEDIL